MNVEIGKYFESFNFIKSNRSKKDLNYYLQLENININDYHIIKKTNKFRLCCIDDFINFKYSGFMIFNKNYYELSYLIKCIDTLNNLSYFTYISKPFPPLHILEKIKII